MKKIILLVAVCCMLALATSSFAADYIITQGTWDQQFLIYDANMNLVKTLNYAPYYSAAKGVFDIDNNLYVTALSASTILKYAYNSVTKDWAATPTIYASGFSGGVRNIAFDYNSGVMYVGATYYDARIWKVTSEGAAPQLVIDLRPLYTNGGKDWGEWGFTCMTVDPNGKIWINKPTPTETGYVRINPVTGTIDMNLFSSKASGLAVGPDINNDGNFDLYLNDFEGRSDTIDVFDCATGAKLVNDWLFDGRVYNMYNFTFGQDKNGDEIADLYLCDIGRAGYSYIWRATNPPQSSTFATGYPNISVGSGPFPNTAPPVPNSSLVAHYTFDENSGTTVIDYSSYGNTATIYGGAARVSVAGGKCIKFDGIDDYVNCGNTPSLDIRNALTVSYWVSIGSTQSSREPGIVGKDMDAFQTTFDTNIGFVYSYINGGGGNTSASVSTNTWTLVTTTFDGTYQRIYINGQLKTKRTSPYSTINQGGNLLIGFGHSSYFTGYVDEVKVYNRTLSDAEIAAFYTQSERDIRNEMFTAPYSDVTGGQVITNGSLSVRAGTSGGVQITNGLSKFVLNSSYSYPGTSIGYNKLNQSSPGGEGGWNPVITKENSTTLKITASGSKYSLTRYLKFNNNRIEVEDTLINNTSSAVGIIVDHSIITPNTISNGKVGQGSTCPLIFFGQPNGDWGFIGEDNIGRLQYHPGCIANTASVHHPNFALDTSASYTFKYAVYPLEPTGDVFNLVNRVRNDWGSNVRIDGPWSGFDVGPGSIVWQDPYSLKKYLERINLNVAETSPWLDYDPGSMDHVITRAEYKTRMMAAAARIRAASPNTKVLGSIETDWVTVDPYDQAMFPNNIGLEIVNRGDSTAAIDGSNIPWKAGNSIKRDSNQNITIEYYSRGGSPQYALGVYPSPTNYQRSFLLDQAAFIMDDCGLDGFYIDEFSQSAGTGIRSYAKTGSTEHAWDGNSVDINPTTGNITTKYVDCSLIGISPRVDIINNAYSRGKIATANSYSSSQNEQSLGINRFAETGFAIEIDMLQTGIEPEDSSELFSSILGTPIGLGVKNPEDPNDDVAQRLMLAVMKYLKHGMVYYHYIYSPLPETGFGSGEYGPINHSMPITPIELHEGWIKGQERIVSCVSYTTSWTNTSAYPHVHFFDDHGREIQAQASTRYANITGSPGNWNVTVHISDWAEFAIIEEDNTDLMAYYKFDEGASNLAHDSSGKSGLATIQGTPNWVPVDDGYCLYFDGTTNYLDCGVSSQLNLSNTVTISAWIAPYSTTNSNEQGIAGKGFGSYLLSFKPTESKANWYISSVTNKTQSTIPNDLWSLVTATFDGTNLKIYVNGQLVSTQASSYSQISQGTNFLIGCIGTLNGLPTNALKGLLDEIKVYNRALSAAEVGQSYDSRELKLRNSMFTNEVENSLMAYYKFDEGTGTTAIDSSGHNNTGTISGASWQSIGTNQYALSFDGVNDYVDCGNSSSLDIHKYITTMFWVNPATTQIANEPGIISKDMRSFAATYYQNNQLYWYISGGGNCTNGSVPSNTWNHIATTFDGTTLKIYKNGVLLSQNTTTISSISSGYSLYIGCQSLISQDTFYGFFKGSIDNVKIYNKTLSINEIAGQYLAEYNIRNNFPPTAIVNAKGITIGNKIYIKDAPVSAKIYNSDGTYNGFALEEQDRFIGIRVMTSTIIRPGAKVDIHGYIYRDNGELVIDARNGAVFHTGTVTPITPFSIATIDTGGALKSNQGAVLDNATKTPKTSSTALNTVGMFMRIRGIVTAVGSDYFYINDGYGVTELLDGSGYIGMKCGKANLSSLPALGDNVEVTGVIGVKLIGGYNTRYLWTTSLSPATISTYAFYVHSGLTDFRNMISLPAQPVYPDPAILFTGIAINNNLQTYIGGTSAKTYTTATASTFGGINYSYGYSFDSSQSNPYAFTYLGYNDPTPLDRWISVPNGVSGGSVLIGVPYNHASNWNDWHTTDLTTLKTVGDADTSTWLDTSGDWYLNGVASLLLPGDSLYQNYGYKVRVNKKLAIIAPSSSTLDKLITGCVLLEDFVGNEYAQIGQIPVVIGTDNNTTNIFRAVVPTQITPISGNFFIDVNSEIYNISLKASHWLRKLAADFNVDVIVLINGDVVDNNEVDFTDINAVRAAYGSFPGDETWNERADVDGSGEVDFTDINIVRSNYGEIGD